MLIRSPYTEVTDKVVFVLDKRSSPANDDNDNVQSSKKLILEQEDTSDSNKAGKATSDGLDRVATNGGILF